MASWMMDPVVEFPGVDFGFPCAKYLGIGTLKFLARSHFRVSCQRVDVIRESIPQFTARACLLLARLCVRGHFRSPLLWNTRWSV